MNKPMPLKDLPDYLKSLKEQGSMGESPAPVVSMGQIIVDEPKKSSWFSKLAIVTVLCAFLTVGGAITYDQMSTKNLTVIVDTDHYEALPQIISESGGEIIAVKQNDSDTYEVEVATRKSKRSFLDWLLKNKGVKKASLK